MNNNTNTTTESTAITCLKTTSVSQHVVFTPSSKIAIINSKFCNFKSIVSVEYEHQYVHELGTKYSKTLFVRLLRPN